VRVSAQFQNGNCWYTPPAVFVRVASKGLTGYGTWKSIRKMEEGELQDLKEGIWLEGGTPPVFCKCCI
jgi:hypothetical protein